MCWRYNNGVMSCVNDEIGCQLIDSPAGSNG